MFQLLVTAICHFPYMFVCMTGYSGPSAQKVWTSIQHENCFGGMSDTCAEKRLFYRYLPCSCCTYTNFTALLTFAMCLI